MSHWTKELPKESGYYWFRDKVSWEGARDNGCRIVDFDVEEETVAFCGDDWLCGGRRGEWDRPIEGEFWPERIFPPSP